MSELKIPAEQGTNPSFGDPNDGDDNDSSKNSSQVNSDMDDNDANHRNHWQNQGRRKNDCDDDDDPGPTYTQQSRHPKSCYKQKSFQQFMKQDLFL